MRPAGVREPCRVDPQRVPTAKDHRALYDVLQLANIARPVVGLAELQGLLVDLPDVLSSLRRIAPDELLDKHRNIALTVTQRRHFDREDVQPVEKIRAKRAIGDCRS